MTRRLLAPLALILTLAVNASAQEPPKAWPEPSLHRLRNTAAADVAKAVTDFATGKKMAVSIVAEPVSNTVLVAGDAAAVKQLNAIIAKLDTPPQQFQIECRFLEVKPEFAEHVGMAANSKEPLWVLTEREHRMLTTVGMREAKARGDLVAVLSRPTLVVADNQTGFMQVGSPGSVPYAIPTSEKHDTPVPPQVTLDCISARITPRMTPEGVFLNMSIEVANQGRSAKMMVSTGLIPDGGALVWRGPKASDGSEYLYIVKLSKVGK